MSDDKDFWAEESGDGAAEEPTQAEFDEAGDEFAGEGDRSAETAQAAFTGLLTGGLTGMLQAIEQSASFALDEDQDVDDPEALARAEEAVRGEGASGGGLADTPLMLKVDEETGVMVPQPAPAKPQPQPPKPPYADGAQDEFPVADADAPEPVPNITVVSGYQRSSLSDNAHLESLSGAGSNIPTPLIFAIGVLIVAAAVAYLLLTHR